MNDVDPIHIRLQQQLSPTVQNPGGINNPANVVKEGENPIPSKAQNNKEANSEKSNEIRMHNGTRPNGSPT